MTRTISKAGLILVLGLSVGGCKKDADTAPPVEPEWTPDESAEPPAAATVHSEPDPGPQLSDEEKEEQAKALYVEAEAKAAASDWTAAVDLYEQAYHLVPGKHGFARKVGVAAEKSGDCKKAIEYHEHFVNYADPEKYADDIASSKASLKALAKKGC